MAAETITEDAITDDTATSTRTRDRPPPSLAGRDAQVAAQVITALAGEGAALRPDQEHAVAALLEPAARVLVVQATGWGKSAVYWTATAIRRSAGAGPTLIVSPLLSLMRDQVAAATRAGLRAATVNSSNVGDWRAIEDDLRSGSLDVLLVSPERLANPGFGRRVLDAVAGSLGLLVIDEAHSVSDWGHDFRPDYRRVADVLQRVNPDTPVLATTATANARVTVDVARQLGDDTLVLRGPLARTSLQLNVVDALSPLQRYGWVVDHLAELPGSGIVYVLTVADADRLVRAIRAVHGDRIAVAAYTGQLEGSERARLEDDLRDNRLKALVATSALGMGYDKPDLGFVVHVGSPPSPVSYYQQVGRAGRAIDHAAVVLLPSEADARIWEYFATATIPEPGLMRRVLGALRQEPVSAVAIEAETGIRRTKVDLMLKQLAVDDAVDRLDGGWVATGKEWHYDAEHYAGIVTTRRREADIMRAYTRGERCLMALLVESLDDPDPVPCGRCSVCRGEPQVGTSASTETLRAVTAELRANALELAPRKMWPGGAFGARGRIPAHLAAEPGRTLVHADAPEWADTLAAARGGDTDATAELGDAAVKALAVWRHSWVARPTVVVALALTGSPVAQAVASRISERGRLPVAELPVDRAGAPGREASGADEAFYWRQALGTSPDVAGQVVLLVADATSTAWPLTVAAAHLRDAGAQAVLPLLVHQPA